MKSKLLPLYIPLIKWAGVITALVAKVSALIPESYVFYGVLTTAIASSLKDTLIKIGDVLDDGEANQSCKG